MPSTPFRQRSGTHTYLCCGFILLFLGFYLWWSPSLYAQQPSATQLFLPLVAGGAGQPDEAPQLSSIQLIKQAEIAGQLTYEQGLVHRVQAVVGNPALPARYVRGNLGLDGSTTLAEAVAKFDMIPA